MENNVYYIYCYSQNEIPFYIGYGKNNRVYNHLKDCYKSDKKHLYFYNKLRKILENDEEFDIKILKTNLSVLEAKTIEQVLIELCGRKNLNKGSLYNLTDGGEGGTGYKFTQEKKNKQSIRMKIKTSSEEHKQWFLDNVAVFRLIKIIQYTKEGDFIKIWNSISEASKFYNTNDSNIHVSLNNINKTAKNFRWRYYTKNYELKLPLINRKQRKYLMKEIVATFKDNSQKIFNSAKQSSTELNLNEDLIRAVCINSEGRKQHKGIKFSYI